MKFLHVLCIITPAQPSSSNEGTNLQGTTSPRYLLTSPGLSVANVINVLLKDISAVGGI